MSEECADNYNIILKNLKNYQPINQHTDTTFKEILIKVNKIINDLLHKLLDNEYNKIILLIFSEGYKIFRNACAIGNDTQNFIYNLPELLSNTKIILEYKYENVHFISNNDEIHIINKLCWQFLANLCVQNINSQECVWRNFNQLLLTIINTINENTDIALMIIYNIFILYGQNDNSLLNDLLIYKLLINIIKEQQNNEETTATDAAGVSTNIKLDFLYIFIEYYLTEYKKFINNVYKVLNDEERVLSLYFINEYIRENNKNWPIQSDIIIYITSDFKKKSDCILKTVTSHIETVSPKEIIVLLEILSNLTGQDNYKELFSNDRSLFLNVGCLLQNINALGKKPDNIFTPIQKLDHLAPNSAINMEKNIELDISYDMKSMMVRILANLSYKNKKIQDLAREMEILPTILNCTNLDARNPLIKEWSILAIRNLCENNIENQNIMNSLTKIGDADNPIIKEFQLDQGSIRIQPATNE